VPCEGGRRHANYLTTSNLKQFSISLQEKTGHQICCGSGQMEKNMQTTYAPDGTTDYYYYYFIITFN
jgi:hypothetical protein